MPTPPIQGHSQHSNNSDNRGNSNGGTPKEQASSDRLKCPECLSHNVHHDDSIGSIICHDCGMVIAENQEHEVHEDSATTFVSSYGTTWVNAVGRAHDERPFAFRGQGRELFQQNPAQKRQHRGKRLSVIKEYLQQISLGTGSSVTDVKRALYLWRIVMDKTQRRIDRVAEDWALACLYFVAKETKKAISLVQIAISAGRAPNVIGVKYRQLKVMLLEEGSITKQHICFNTDEDPWIILDRIMTIGSEESQQQGRYDLLPSNIKSVLGIGATDLASRRSCLRSLLISAQKCLTVALDSTLLTGRYTNPLAAACLVVSIEVKLELEKCPDELFDLVATEFFSTTDTVRSRYHELRRCMLNWAKRLPFLSGKVSKGRIKQGQLVYYMEDVLTFFGQLKDQNQILWLNLERDTDVELEKTEAEAEAQEEESSSWSEGSSDDSAELKTLERRTVFPTAESRDKGKEKAPLEGAALGEAIHVEGSTHLPPPSFQTNRARDERLLRQFRRAKEILALQRSSCECDADEFLNEDPGVKRILTLLRLGKRTEQEILSAPMSTLEYWCRRDEAVEGSSLEKTNAELDAIDLTENDLSDQEYALYLRTQAEAKAVLQVKGQDFAEAEKRSRLIANEARERQKRKERRQYQMDIKAFGLADRGGAPKNDRSKDSTGSDREVSTVDKRPTKRARTGRSEKLCLEALEALEREQEELEQGKEGASRNDDTL